MSDDRIARSTKEVQDFYDGPADEIYRRVWGEHLHLGLPGPGITSREQAADHATRVMADAAGIAAGMAVLDIGCGFGLTARDLARWYGCRVLGLNISDKEVTAANHRATREGIAHLATFQLGDFHHLDFPADQFDIVWSQEALLYGVDKLAVLAEAKRVLKPGGRLAFSDVLASRVMTKQDRERVYARVHTPLMWDKPDYAEALDQLGLETLRIEDWSAHVAADYAQGRDRICADYEQLVAVAGAAAVDRMLGGLEVWVAKAEEGLIGWAFFLARKPA